MVVLRYSLDMVIQIHTKVHYFNHFQVLQATLFKCSANRCLEIWCIPEGPVGFSCHDPSLGYEDILSNWNDYAEVFSLSLHWPWRSLIYSWAKANEVSMMQVKKNSC